MYYCGKIACVVFCARLIECGVNLNVDDCAIKADLYWDQVALPTDVRFNVYEGDRDYVGQLLKNWYSHLPKTTPVYIYGYDIVKGNDSLIKTTYLSQHYINVIIMRHNLIRQLLDNFSSIKFKPDNKATYVFVILQSRHENCTDNNDLKDLLELFWKAYSIVRLLAIKPCSTCDHGRLYRYDPFVYNAVEDVWGAMRNESLDQFNELVKPSKISRSYGGYPLRVSIFPRVPTVVDSLPASMSHLGCDQVHSHGFSGLDGCVLANMVKILDFTAVLVGPLDKADYGYKLPNGSYIGSLGDVVYKRADISGNSRFINVFDAANAEYTSPVNNDVVCFVVPKAEIVPKWMMIFHCFKLSTWGALIAIIITNGVFWYLLHRVRFPGETYRPKNLVGSILDIFRIFLSGSFFNVPTLINRRLLLTTCMIFNVITVGIFQGTLFTSFTGVSYYPDINTLEDLYESKLPIATSLDLFQTDDVDVMRKLKTRMVFLASKALSRAAVKRDVVAVERMTDATFFIRTQYVSRTGEPLLHIVPDCPSSYFLAYIVPKGSPFLLRFNSLLTRFREAGLIQKWYYEIVDGLVMNFKFNNLSYEDRYRDIDLYDLQTSFYLLFVGCCISCLVLMGEIYFY